MKRYQGKVVLVTGGSRGLGAATALRFASEGANVVIIYAQDETSTNKVVNEIKKIGSRSTSIKCDVSDEKSVIKMIDMVITEYDKIDVLVNNAGIAIDIPFAEKSSDIWHRTIDVNLNGVYYCTKHAIPHINKGGSIINISSTNGIDTYHPDSVDYDVSKAGVIMFTKAMARTLAPNIRINSVAPGWFNTDMNADLPKYYIESEKRKIALGRLGKPEEIASTVAFLASEDASFITGSVLVVDGGYGGAV